MKADSLPPVAMKRRGQFELIPDFLSQQQVKKNIQNIEEMDMMTAALEKQDQINDNSGPSMAELMKMKRAKTEKLIEESKENTGNGPSKSDIEERKARLLA